MWELTNTGLAAVSGVFGHLSQNLEWSLVAAFLAAIIEAVAVIGTVFPGTFLLMGIAGGAAASGQPMLPFLAVAALGAAIGDFVSYWLGHRYRFVLRQWWPLAQHPGLLARADRFFARFGIYSVMLCRFIPGLRSMVPLAAGIAGMPLARFLVANLSSAVVWAAAHVWPAEIAGLTIDRLRNGHWWAAALLGIGLLACGIAGWALHRRLSRHAGP